MSLDPKKRQLKVAMTKEAAPKDSVVTENVTTSNTPVPIKEDLEQVAPRAEASHQVKTVNIVRPSKFRHIEGKFRHRSTFISKMPSLSSTVPGDSNAFQVNCLFDMATVISSKFIG